MTKFEAIKLVLTVVGGTCWTVVYIEGIRVGFRDRSYAIPFYALALNIAWELLHTVFGFQSGVSVQTIINAVWFACDVGILYTYFRFGRRHFPSNLSSRDFISWSLLGLAAAVAIEYAFVREFGVAVGAGYSAFLQNLLMSVLFIDMLVRRGNSEGQSLYLSVSKWIGTLTPTILVGIVGDGGFPNGSFLILVLGILCSVFDLIYVWMLFKVMKRTASDSVSAASIRA